ncbi:hypothetical protein OSB04_000979 [Centaurea solstitialis]|uniref:SWIM-type domain-containing protein n=1 Tax=Centaurea solstitialis TaxID=347529 RepID=A0AA38U9F1_9ASTR|nr:hypothetical protein OSB04_000979 [Centaurea solstitialis]
MIPAFNLTIHYDGCFMYQPLRYENGKALEVTVERITYDEMVSFIEFDTKTIISSLYYCLPGSELDRGLMKVDNDNDVECLFDIGHSYGPVEVYVDHFGDDLTFYLATNGEKNGNNVDEEMVEGEGDGDKNVDMEGEGDGEKNVDMEGEGDGEKNVDMEGEGDDDFSDLEDVDIEYEAEDDDFSDVHSIDHLSEGEDELKEVRKGKQSAKEEGPKEKPKLGVNKNRESNEMDDTLQVEHEQFMEDLLKALKCGDKESEDPFNADEEKEEENFPIHDAETHWKLKRPLVDERYESPKQLKECITCYALANGFSIWYERSSTTKIIARCGSRPPRISDPSKGKQRKDEHNCSRNFKYGSLINYKWIGSKFGHRIRCNPDIKLVEIAELVLKKYKCQVTPSICSRARSWAINEYEKLLEEHYGMLRAYGDELLRSNPGSTVKLDVTVNPDEKTYFDRIYVCLHGLKEGWKRGCRRVIALDGCFLKGACGGELLTAIGRDGNNHIFPVAWAVVNVENKDNWTWFINLVGEDLDIVNGEGLTLISDQHEGLVQAVKDIMPNAEHRQCARHIYENFRKVYSKASYPQLFESVMKEIRLANPNAHKYLMEREPKTWSRAYFEVNRGCDSVENGFSECFNFVLLKVRHKPIITMLEAIRTILMERMNTMRRISESWIDDICPSIKKKLDYAKDQQRFWKVIPGGGLTFEVRLGNDAFIVNEESKTCTCRMWQLSGLPCHHAVAALFYIHKHPEDCSILLLPVQGMNQWKTNDLNKPLPPKPKRMPGRPKKQRKKAIHEPSPHHGKVSKQGSVMTCQKCFQVGHNRRGCKATVGHRPAPKASKPVGRPRKCDQGSADKGKGKMTDQGSQPKTASVGGFMSDARRTYQPEQAQTKAHEGEGQKKKAPLPPRRRHSERIAKLPKPPIKGPGESSVRPMEIWPLKVVHVQSATMGQPTPLNFGFFRKLSQRT